MTTSLSVSEGYAAWAEIYDDEGNPLIPPEEPAIRELMGEVAGRNVLDLGCGTGRHAQWLVESGASVVALDSTPEMLAKAREKLAGRDVCWVEHDLTTPLRIADASFDAVVMGLVVEHVAELDPVFREVARVLRGGGRFVLSNLHPDRTAGGQQARFIDPETGERRPIVSHHRTIDEYRAEAERAGLTFIADRTLIVPPELSERYPRAGRYVGLPLGWVASWSR